MQGYNCIMVYNYLGDKLLFCKRIKDPYKGLYNLVGGKIEINEDGFTAAYRELNEETGIKSSDIILHHMMDFTYYNQNCYVEVYVGKLSGDIELYEETHPLEWLSVDEDFFDFGKFAGEGNIGHMVEQVNIYGMGEKRPEIGGHRTIIKSISQNTLINKDLLDNINKIHTTTLGAERIKKNLSLDIDEDVVEWCKFKISNSDDIKRKGKNWYVKCDDFTLTINAYSYTIITAHKNKN